MDAWLRDFSLAPFTDAWLTQVLGNAVQYFVAFTLIVTRIGGMVALSPMFGHTDFPVQIRVLLVTSLALLMTPAILSIDSGRTFRRFDQNQDGTLEEAEVPPQLRTLADRLLARSGKPPGEALLESEFRLELPLPRTPLDFAWLAACEFAVGVVLGLGMLTFLSGLQLAGQLIDQQTGVSLGEVFNPDLDTSGSLTGALLYLVGTIAFILVGGHLLLVSAVMETYQALPVGYAFVSTSTVDLMRNLVTQSLVLSTQVAAPILGTMAVVGIAMGFLGHTIPQINVLVIGFPIRTLVGLLLLGMSLNGIGELLERVIPATIELIKNSLMGMGP